MNNLCLPAKTYLIISIIALIIMLFQNVGGYSNQYCLGNYSCDIKNMSLLFIFKIIYIVIFTLILNLLCENNLTIISWILVLIPFIFFFIIIASIMMFGTNNYLYYL